MQFMEHPSYSVVLGAVNALRFICEDSAVVLTSISKESNTSVLHFVVPKLLSLAYKSDNVELLLNIMNCFEAIEVVQTPSTGYGEECDDVPIAVAANFQAILDVRV